MEMAFYQTGDYYFNYNLVMLFDASDDGMRENKMSRMRVQRALDSFRHPKACNLDMYNFHYLYRKVVSKMYFTQFTSNFFYSR